MTLVQTAAAPFIVSPAKPIDSEEGYLTGSSAFWPRLTWRRLVLLAGYLLLLLEGLELLGAGDPVGIVYLGGAVLGALFLHRRLITSLIWVVVVVDGGLDIAAGSQFGLLLVAGGLAGIGLAWTPDPPVVVASRQPEAPPDPAASPAKSVAVAEEAASQPPVPVAAITDTDGRAPAIRLTLRTLGKLQLLLGEEDVTSELLKRPVQCFVWLHLLAREAQRPGVETLRTGVAPEVFPGLTAQSQRERLRDILRDIRQLRPEVANCVVAKDERLAFSAADCDWDLDRLHRLEARCREAGQVLPEELLSEVEAALSEQSGDFLPGWEDLEHRVTKGRGAAGSIVRDVRRMVDETRGNLVALLAANYRDRGEVARAITPLQRAFQSNPEREDLANSLLAAYIETGQRDRAETFKQRYQKGDV